jgi:hypothetical protein
MFITALGKRFRGHRSARLRVDGHVGRGFEPVAEAFADNFTRPDDQSWDGGVHG